MIIDANGGIIDKERFLGVIKSGALTHEMMESDDIRVRVYGESAVITALTRTKGEFMGQAFSTQERATDVLSGWMDDGNAYCRSSLASLRSSRGPFWRVRSVHTGVEGRSTLT